MLVPPVLGAVGAGLITTWLATTPEAKWAGYQVLYDICMGLGMTGASLAVQSALPQPDVPLAVAALYFAREMGSAIFIAAVENLLLTLLVKGFEAIPELGGLATQLSEAGASEIRNEIRGSGEHMLEEAIDAFNAALRHVWYLALALTLATIVPFFLIKWLNLNQVAKQRTEEAESCKQEATQKVEEA